MKKRIDTKGSVRLRRARRAALCLVSFAFIFLVAAAFLDAFALQTRLTRSAAARMSRRLSTDPRAIDSLNAVFSTDAPTAGADLRSTDVKHSRDAFLVARAEEWLAAPNERSEETRNRDVVVGLARWNVAPERAAPFLRDPGDAALFSDVERTTLLSERRRVADASRDAADAIAELAGDAPDDAIDDALLFLRELGANGVDEDEAPIDDAFLWVSSDAVGDPISSAAFATLDDFAPDADAILVAKLCASTARLFILITIGLVPGGCASFGYFAFVALLILIGALISTLRSRREKRARFRTSESLRRLDSSRFLSTIRLLI